MKRALLAALACACLTACASVPEQRPLATLAQVRAAYISTCGEVSRLRDAGLDLPAARVGCVRADDVLDAADLAYQAGRLAEATSGATRALAYITAAQALVAASGKVK